MKIITQNGLFNVSLASLTMFGIIIIVTRALKDAQLYHYYISAVLLVVSLVCIILWFNKIVKEQTKEELQ